MKAGWTSKPLEDACTFINGLWKGEKAPLKTVGVIRNTNFTKDGNLDDTDIAFIEVEVKKFEKRKLSPGDIILEKSGGGPKQAVGRVVLFDMPEGDYSFSNFTAAIRVKSPDELDAKYLHKFLHWTYLSGVTEGMQSNSTGIRNLDGDKYKAIRVSYPSIAEQRRIATLLDEAFADIATAKANAEKNLQNSGELFDSHLQSIFKDEGQEWPVMPLEKVASIVNGFAFKSGDFSPSGETKCIKITNVGVREFVCESEGRLPKQFSNKFTSVSIPAGSIVMALTRTIISSGLKVAVVPSDYDNALLNQRVAAILPYKDGISMSYLFAYLSSQAVAKYVTERVNTLMQPNLSIVDLRSMPIPTPSFSQQEKITELIALLTEETHRLESIYRQKLTALDDLKKSLLHQAFSGQL